MSVILEFNKQEKQRLIKTWTKGKIAGDGTESICYQIDDYVYKVLNNHFCSTYDENEIYNEEIDLESFLFPEEIYISNNKIFATKTKYIKNEIDKKRIYSGILPDINKIKDTIPTFINDINELTKKNILIADMAWRNLIFNNGKLYAIDTLHYTRKKEHLQIDVYKWNIGQLRQAILEFTLVYEEVCKKKNISLSADELKTLHELPFYIKKVAKKRKLENKKENAQKIKRA